MPTTLDFYGPVEAAVNNVFEQRFKDRDQRPKVVSALMNWLTLKARKKPVPDLEARIERVRGQVEKLVEKMSIVIENGKPVVKASGSDEETLKMFRLGTSWFDPNPDLMETILSGLFNE